MLRTKKPRVYSLANRSVRFDRLKVKRRKYRRLKRYSGEQTTSTKVQHFTDFSSDLHQIAHTFKYHYPKQAIFHQDP